MVATRDARSQFKWHSTNNKIQFYACDGARVRGYAIKVKKHGRNVLPTICGRLTNKTQANPVAAFALRFKMIMLTATSTK
jgi:hypothetical protein